MNQVIERELTRHLSMANVPRSQAKEVVASSISSTKSSIRLVEREVVEKINTEVRLITSCQLENRHALCRFDHKIVE